MKEYLTLAFFVIVIILACGCTTNPLLEPKQYTPEELAQQQKALESMARDTAALAAPNVKKIIDRLEGAYILLQLTVEQHDSGAISKPEAYLQLSDIADLHFNIKKETSNMSKPSLFEELIVAMEDTAIYRWSACNSLKKYLDGGSMKELEKARDLFTAGDMEWNKVVRLWMEYERSVEN